MPIHKSSSTRLNYDIHEAFGGGGSSVVLLHGLGSCGEDWILQIPALTAEYRVLTVDLPGHGRSPHGKEWPTIPSMGMAIGRWLADVVHEPAHVVGLSLGGAVALQLGVDHPDLVRSITAVNTFARLRLGGRGLLRSIVRVSLLLMGRMDWLGEWVAAGLFPKEDQIQFRSEAAARISSNPRSSYLQAVMAVARFNLHPRLSEISAPTLVIAGDQDTTVPYSAKIELAQGIPGARFETIRGSGHVTPFDATEVFNRMVLDFLKGV